MRIKKNDVEATAPVEAGTEAAAPSVRVSRDDKPRKDTGFVVYSLPGGGQVYFPATRFAGPAPESLEIVGLVLEPAAKPKAKLTEEERKAAAEARKNEPPSVKAERAKAIAAKAVARAEKLAALVGKTEAEYEASKA